MSEVQVINFFNCISFCDQLFQLHLVPFNIFKYHVSKYVFEFVQDEFSAVITKALLTLVHGLETKFDAEMVAMTRVPWASLESVGDQSE